MTIPMVPHGHQNKRSIVMFHSQKVVKLNGDKKDQKSIAKNLKVISDRNKTNPQTRSKVNV